MKDYDKICDFQNLYSAHKKARLGKRHVKEVIEFEMNISASLDRLAFALKEKTYRIAGYYSFLVHDPKERIIHALHYPDRVVQHCLCDQVLEPLLEPRLVYDNAACRKGKGTHFTIQRVNAFLKSFFHRYGTKGYVLRCDIHKFFDSMDHEVLKSKLAKLIKDPDVMDLLAGIIDSYETEKGKGFPLGNQTSQWFALYYLDGFDRLVKERLGIRYYSRYMDDCILIHPSKEYLKHCLAQMTDYLETELKLEFNEKTQIHPIPTGFDYLGWHFYLADSSKIIRKLKTQAKNRYKQKLQHLQKAYAYGHMSIKEIDQVLNSYQAHLSHGHAYHLQAKLMHGFVLTKKKYNIF